MADPAQVLAAVSPDTRADLTTRSNRKGLLHLAKHVSLISVLMAYVAVGLPFWWMAMFPLGVALVFLFTLQHECTHQTPFRSVWLNEIIGHICAVVLIQPFLWFRAFHMAHHRHTNDPAKDPELQGDSKPQTWAAFTWHVATPGYWAGKLQVLWTQARGHHDDSYIAARAGKRIKTEARVLIVIYLDIALFTLRINPILIWLWLVPIALGFPVLRLYLLTEHGRCPQVANMFQNSRTTLTNSAVRLLSWNMPYHAEHHAYPNVPFHKLPDAHAIAAPHLHAVTDGYVAFTKTYTKTLNGTAGGAPLA